MGVYDQRAGVYAEFFWGQGSGVYAERAGVYAEDREFMMKIRRLCIQVKYREAPPLKTGLVCFGLIVDVAVR